MGWFSSIFEDSAKGILTGVKDLADEFFTSDEERAEFELKAKRIFQDRLTELEKTARRELEAKEKILVAELEHGDSYTKRARPTVVYSGLAMIFFNYTVAPLIGSQQLDLPAEFWWGWSAVVGTWSIGRTAERMNVSNAFTRKVTGSKSQPSIMD